MPIFTGQQFRRLGTSIQRGEGIFEITVPERGQARFRLRPEAEGGYEFLGGPLPEAAREFLTPEQQEQFGIRLPEKPLALAEGEVSLAGIGVSLPAFDERDEEAIRAAEERRFGLRRERVRAEFEPAIREAREEAVAEERALAGELGVGRRFSSSARAFIKFIDTENKKEISRLEKRRDEALADLDMAEVSSINEAIEAERNKRQEDFNNIVRIIQLAQTQATAQRAEAREERLVRTEELNRFNDLLEAGAFDDYKNEDVVSYSISTGLTEGMIESAIEAHKQKRNTKLDTRKFPDGSVRATLIDEDTGEVLSQEVLAEAPPKEVPTPIGEIPTFAEFLRKTQERTGMIFGPGYDFRPLRIAYDEEVKFIRDETLEKGEEAGGVEYEDL